MPTGFFILFGAAVIAYLICIVYGVKAFRNVRHDAPFRKAPDIVYFFAPKRVRSLQNRINTVVFAPELLTPRGAVYRRRCLGAAAVFAALIIAMMLFGEP